MTRILLCSLLLVYTLSTTAQKLTEVEFALSTIQYTPETDDKFDSLYSHAKKSLGAYLEKKTITDTLQNLDFTASADGTLRTYTFSHYSGGTRGAVSTTFFQWKKTDGTYGIYLLKNEIRFLDIYALPAKNKTLYLLTGIEQANGKTYLGYAMVAQIKNNYLILDHPAFFGQSSTLVYQNDQETEPSKCLACIEYSEKDQTLTIGPMSQNDTIGIETKKGTETKVKNVKTYQLKFDGNTFVKK